MKFIFRALAIFWISIGALNCGGESYKNSRDASSGEEDAASFEIRSGVEIRANRWPFVGAVMSSAGFCTGTLLSPYHVLSAAHCFSDSNSTIYFTLTPRVSEATPEQKIKVKTLHRHPLYSKNDTRNDIAVLVLEKPIHLSKYADLPKQDPFLSYRPTLMPIVGFGGDSTSNTSRIKREGLMRFSGFSRGVRRNPVTGNIVADNGRRLFVRPTSANNVGCPGDSGGPIFLNRTSTTVVGVLASGQIDPSKVHLNQCEKTISNAYDLTFAYSPWIKLKMNQRRASAWTNPIAPHDVNGDTRITAMDALNVINNISKQISGRTKQSDDFFLDVNGDGRVSSNDALQVINAIAKGLGGSIFGGNANEKQDMSNFALTSALRGNWSPAIAEVRKAARRIDIRLRLSVSSWGYFYNQGGHQGKWMFGRKGKWYFITPNGRLHRYIPGPWKNGRVRYEQVAQLLPVFYQNPSWLHR